MKELKKFKSFMILEEHLEILKIAEGNNKTFKKQYLLMFRMEKLGFNYITNSVIESFTSTIF